MKRILFVVVSLVALWLVFLYHADATVRLMTGTRAYVGVSDDTRPTLSSSDAGARFIEADTGREYLWDGSSWGMVGVTPRYSTAPDTLITVGSTDVHYMGGFRTFTVMNDLTNNGSNVRVYIEGKVGSSGWVNLSESGDSTHITTNGSFGWAYSGYVDSVRATISSGSGDTSFTSVWHWLFGGE